MGTHSECGQTVIELAIFFMGFFVSLAFLFPQFIDQFQKSIQSVSLTKEQTSK
jgi:predicted PurR-regulated permease PerM